MKKLLVICSLFAMSACVTESPVEPDSSGKPGFFCWECVLTVTATYNGRSSTQRTTTSVCNRTESQIRHAEREASTTSSGTGYTAKSVMKCTRR
jgi:hypothetical protein